MHFTCFTKKSEKYVTIEFNFNDFNIVVHKGKQETFKREYCDLKTQTRGILTRGHCDSQREANILTRMLPFRKARHMYFNYENIEIHKGK